MAKFSAFRHFLRDEAHYGKPLQNAWTKAIRDSGFDEKYEDELITHLRGKLNAHGGEHYDTNVSDEVKKALSVAPNFQKAGLGAEMWDQGKYLGKYPQASAKDTILKRKAAHDNRMLRAKGATLKNDSEVWDAALKRSEGGTFGDFLKNYQQINVGSNIAKSKAARASSGFKAFASEENAAATNLPAPVKATTPVTQTLPTPAASSNLPATTVPSAQPAFPVINNPAMASTKMPLLTSSAKKASGGSGNSIQQKLAERRKILEEFKNDHGYSQQEFSHFYKGSGDLNAAEKYMVKNRYNQANSAWANYQEAIKAGKADEAAAIRKQYGNAENLGGFQRHAAKGMESGPSISDYAWGYKIPQATLGGGIGVGAFAAVMNASTGQKSNAELYSAPF